MFLGYAYAKKKAEAQARETDLRQIGAKQTWVDFPGSNRAERADLFVQGIRSKDVLLLLQRKDLGDGKEIARFEEMVKAKGATIEIKAPEAPSRQRPGPQTALGAITYDQERRIRHYWHGPFKAQVAIEKACEVLGRDVTRNMLNRQLGPRSKPKPWINNPPDQAKTKEAVE